jgi:hypothetical protein
MKECCRRWRNFAAGNSYKGTSEEALLGLGHEIELSTNYSIPSLTLTLEQIRKDFGRNVFQKAVENETIHGSVRAYI